DRQIGVRILPQREEILVRFAAPGHVTTHRRHARQAHMRERIQWREWRVPSVVEDLLKLYRRFRASPQFQVSLPAREMAAEFSGRFVARYRLQSLNRLFRIPVLQFHRRANRWLPDGVDDRVFRVELAQFVSERFGLMRIAAQGERERRARTRNTPALQLQPLR